MKRNITKMLFIPFFILHMFLLSPFVYAQSEEEKKFLLMYFKEDELEVISATRSLKSITRVAENIEVVTADDIELMNAHTLAEVLNTVTGVQIQWAGADLGSIALPLIQGSVFLHVAVLVDGVMVNNLGASSPELAAILPLQIIKRIEIIKGPASSVWGSSLGGVINIITKSDTNKEGWNGTLSASYGERNTGDYRAEIYGTKGKFGYYLFAGDLRTNGLKRDFDVLADRLYAKLNYKITPGTEILFSLYHDKGRRGEGDDQISDPSIKFSDRFDHTLATISLQSKINSETSLNFSFWTLEQTFKWYMNQISDGVDLYKAKYKDIKNGGNAKLIRIHGIHTIVVGADYDKGILKSDVILDGKQEITKWALFANDTLVWDKLSVSPGLRYDNTDTNGNFVSPSLGITYQVTADTLLRATVARGFRIPILLETFGDDISYKSNPNLKVEKVWSYQAGIETTAVPHVWLKVAIFRHDIRDAIDEMPVTANMFTKINKGKVRRQGVEMEMKTAAVYNTSLFAGAAFIDAKDLITNQTLKSDVPRYTFDAGVKYIEKSFKAILQGHYIWWNEEAFKNAKYNAMIFDMSASKTVYNHNDRSCDLFFTAHNIFNGSQYRRDYFPNAGRWAEAGVRYKF